MHGIFESIETLRLSRRKSEQYPGSLPLGVHLPEPRPLPEMAQGVGDLMQYLYIYIYIYN